MKSRLPISLMRKVMEVGVITYLVCMIPCGQSFADEPSVEFVSSTAQTVPEEIAWSRTTISDTLRLIDVHKKSLEAKLQSLRQAGASVLVVSKGRGVSDFFSALDLRGRDLYPVGSNIIEAYGDWGTGISQEKDFVNPAAGYSTYLFGLQVGLCRLNFALFNWDTWFSQDCDLVTPDAKDLLRWSLVEFLANTPTQSGGDLLNFQYNQVLYMMEEHLPYTIKDGLVSCPDLFGIFGVDSFYLMREASGSIPGYKILISENDPWKAKFVALPVNVSDYISNAHLDQTRMIISFQPQS